MSNKQVGWNERLTRKDSPYGAIVKEKYEKDSTMLLIDARLMSYASFHTRQLTTSDGVDTSVAQGLIDQIQGLCEAANTHRWCLVWDGVPSYRRRIFKGYKIRQDRERTMEEHESHKRMLRSIDTAHEIGKLLNWPTACLSEVEADDLIGIFSQMLLRGAIPQGTIKRVMLITEDLDYYQLIRGKECVMYRGRMQEVVDEDALYEMYRLTPQQFIDYKALIGEGESGDNIPHIEGVGDITARKLLGAHKSIQQLHDHVDVLATRKNGLKSKRDANIHAGKQITWRAYELSRILTGANELAKCYPGEYDKIRSEWVGARAALMHGLNLNKHANLTDLAAFKGRYEFESFDPQRWARTTGFKIGI